MSISFRDFLGLLRRRLWIVLGFVIVSVAVSSYLWLAREASYTASAVVRLRDARSELSGGLVEGTASGGGVRGVDRLASELQVIRSRATAEAVVDSTPELLIRVPRILDGLIEDLRVGPSPQIDSVLLTFGETLVLAQGPGGRATAPYGAHIDLNELRFTVSSRPPVETAIVRIVNRGAAIEAVLSGIWAASREGTNIIDIYHTANDRASAVLTANRIAEVYQSLSVSRAQEDVRLRREFLEAQLHESDSLLGQARRELAAFRAQRRLFDVGEGGAAAPAEVGQHAVRRSELEAERQLYTDFARQLREADTTGSFRRLIRDVIAIPDLTGHPEVGQLYRQLLSYEFARDTLAMATSADNPDVRRMEGLIEFTEDRLVGVSISALESLVSQVDARIRILDRFRSESEASLRRYSTIEAEEARLVQQVSAAGSIADQLRGELQKAQLAEAVEVGDIEILERAIGARAVGARTGQNVGLVLFLGLAFGVIGAVVVDRLDSSIRGPKELAALGLPVLGVVPRLEEGVDGGAAAQAPVIEALRGVKLNLTYAHGTAGSLVTTLSSPSGGDGKSFVASNLALAFAFGGQRTLLIDGDLRKGAVHQLLNRERKPGLTDYLTEAASEEQVIQKTDFPRLDLISSGTRTARAPEHLNSDRMSQLVLRLRSRYGAILIDSPPLGAGVDALALGTVTGNLLLVVRSGITNREVTEAKLDILDGLPVRLLGVVINAVRDRHDQYYGYYMDGYEFEVEDAGNRKVVRQRVFPPLERSAKGKKPRRRRST